MARQQRVFIDTSELFPFTIMDVLLTLSEDFLFTWVWTDELLDEWEHVIVREGIRTPESAHSVTDAVRAHFGRYRIDPGLYRDKVTDDLSPDPGDRLHAAACVYGDVDVLLTRNLKHFQAPAIGQAGVQVMTSDSFLSTLLTRRRVAVIESFTRAALSKKNPPVTPVQLAAGSPPRAPHDSLNDFGLTSCSETQGPTCSRSPIATNLAGEARNPRTSASHIEPIQIQRAHPVTRSGTSRRAAGLEKPRRLVRAYVASRDGAALQSCAGTS
ncbi:PIN domain-containing protein [Microbacterium sp. ASV49]|uniref:PIN domain-containing protein n=1 Tax=Microbacterium candidum TaxID=3041922 RepID=A0ABT7MW42_9MICO|nr:PIN domain-containing protein [Microbacterium sp. ASV49]MDL9978659.1 PIN domain-containing protein [Microbacterium sp. ASV49]